MNTLTSEQQSMLATWQQHTYAELVLKDAALATMIENCPSSEFLRQQAG
jgi:hypothetical protein